MCSCLLAADLLPGNQLFVDVCSVSCSMIIPLSEDASSGHYRRTNMGHSNTALLPRSRCRNTIVGTLYSSMESLTRGEKVFLIRGPFGISILGMGCLCA